MKFHVLGLFPDVAFIILGKTTKGNVAKSLINICFTI